MPSDPLKPLAVFCSQPESKQYIKAAPNPEKLRNALTEPDAGGTISIKTAFDLDLTIKRDPDSKDISVTMEAPSLKEGTEDSANTTAPNGNTTSQTSPTEPLRYYTVNPEHGTDFLWYDANDQDHHKIFVEDISEELSLLPRTFLRTYNAWVTRYRSNFKASCFDDRYYFPSVFFTPAEDVAWTVAGFLLAWRIALEPHVGSVMYLADRGEYMQKKGTETDVTLRFLADQAVVLESGDFPE